MYNIAEIPCNSLVVVDNYVLNDKEKMEENLIPLFDAILPTELKIEFDLTVFALLCDDKGNNHKNVKNRYEEINGILNRVRPDMKISLSVVKVKKDHFHDRNIVSNNFFIGSGGGFDLFNRNGMSQKTTTIFAFHPFFYMHCCWSRKAYSDLLNEASSIFEIATDFDQEKYYLPDSVYGNKKNRLLDQIIRNNKK